MKKIYWIIICVFTLYSCQKNKTDEDNITIAFGSCNNQVLENTFWKEIAKNNPKVWIWGGDIIYSDTEDMSFMKQNYLKQKNNTAYANFIKNVDVLGTWDDHDYGLNDGGAEYSKKAEVQQLLLDFLDVPKNDKRRKKKGVYHSKDYHINNKSIKIILLDTRYFRSALTPDTISSKRYLPSKNINNTMLGTAQWNWLENELSNSKAEFNIIMSSIQFLSAEHGFESWGNMPNEIAKLENLLKSSGAKNVILLSGDRHISEISKKEIPELNYPLIDFTSSGLTHSYTSYKGEPNKYRIVDVVADKSFGLLKIDLKSNTVDFEIRGEKNVLLRSLNQKYVQ